MKRYSILLLIFIFSIILRFPNLIKPLSSHHEWATAQVLIHHYIWKKESPFKYKFNPITTFPGESNRFIPVAPHFYMDGEGRFYYISHPPFYIIFPYLLMNFLPGFPNEYYIRVFVLILHFLSSFGVFLIIYHLYRKWSYAFLSYLMFIFYPVNLWALANLYISQILAVPLFIWIIYFYLRSEEKMIFKILFYFLNFLNMYSSWFGFFLSFVFVVFFMIKKRYKKALILIVISIFALILVLLQYSLINGFENLFKYYIKKFFLRGAYTSKVNDINILSKKGWFNLFKFYIKNWALFLLYFIFLVAIYWALYQKNFWRSFSVKEKEIILISSIPVFLEQLVFFNLVAIHDYWSITFGVPLTFLIIIFLDKVSALLPEFKRKFLNRFFIFCLISGYFVYVVFNPFFKRKYWDTKRIGEYIKNIAKKDEIVFSWNFWGFPHVIYYAKRNVYPIWWNEKNAYKFLIKRGFKKGVVIYIKYEPYLKIWHKKIKIE